MAPPDRARQPASAGQVIFMPSEAPVSDSGARNRQRILDALEDCPGLCFRALLRATGLAAGTLRYHVATMERHGQIRTVMHGRRVLHFTEAAPPTPERIRDAFLLELGEGWRAVYDHVASHPGRRQGAILDAFPDASRSTVQNRLRRLVELGFLQEHRVGLQGVAYEPATMAHSISAVGRDPPSTRLDVGYNRTHIRPGSV